MNPNGLCVNIGYWNIKGYKSTVVGEKMKDREFLDTVGKSDIIGIGEIQSPKEIDIEGYISKKQKTRENAARDRNFLSVFLLKSI